MRAIYHSLFQDCGYRPYSAATKYKKPIKCTSA
jgi:hypothetical protein